MTGFLNSWSSLIGQTLTELAKDKPNAKVTESNTSQFLKSLETIESELSAQINYLTTVSTGKEAIIVCIQSLPSLSSSFEGFTSCL